LHGLKILQLTLREPICGPEVTPEEINKGIRWFIPHLISKVEKLNHKMKGTTIKDLISLYENNNLDMGYLI